MSHWNYRVISHDKDGGEWYGIHEVYYDDEEVPHSVSTNESPIYGESPTEIGWTLDKMKEALKKPTLKFSYFENLK